MGTIFDRSQADSSVRRTSGTLPRTQRLRDFVDQVGALPCAEVTAELYGQIKTSLRKQGTPIPENDIWIAASGLQHSLTLVTRDVHFDGVRSLQRAR